MIHPHVDIAETTVAKVQSLLDCTKIAKASVDGVEVTQYHASVTTRVKLDLGGGVKLHLYLDEPKEKT